MKPPACLLKRFCLSGCQIIIGILLLSSCRYSYIPNRVNTGLFTDKGELHAELAVGNSGFDPQVAFAAPNNMVFIANGSFRTGDSQVTRIIDGEASTFSRPEGHRSFEAGVGYYDKLPGKGVFEIIGGYGYGEIESLGVQINTNTPVDLSGYLPLFLVLPPYLSLYLLHYDLIDHNTAAGNASFHKFFIQPTIGLSAKNFDVGFTPKITHVSVNVLDKNHGNFYIEPVFTMRAGAKYVKLTSQLGWSFLLDTHEVRYNRRSLLFSLGIMIDLQTIK